MSFLSLNILSKRFSGQTVLDGLSLEIEQGEFFSVLGPSGCGKTTLLRLIAGFESPETGTVSLEGRDITSLPPRERGIGMVFQNYALFPHMDVFRNVAYGLRVRRVSAGEIRQRVLKTLESVNLTEKASAPVASLSGGEQQRVALARALVTAPALLLLDEPLSNLDVSLRLRTREELRGLQRKVGITTIYVTHDQSEALALSDRLAVMRAGVLEQVGPPPELYDRPASPFVARFLGGSNLLTREDLAYLGSPAGPDPGEKGILAVKPEAVSVHDPGTVGCIEALVVDREFQGFLTEVRFQVRGRPIRASLVSSALSADVVPGAAVAIGIDWSRCVIFPEGER